MEGLEELLDLKTVKHISNFVEEEMDALKSVEDFKLKEKKLSILTEEIENALPEELKEKFDDMTRLTYQVEEYYFSLAYLLGIRDGKKLDKI